MLLKPPRSNMLLSRVVEELHGSWRNYTINPGRGGTTRTPVTGRGEEESSRPRGRAVGRGQGGGFGGTLRKATEEAPEACLSPANNNCNSGPSRGRAQHNSTPPPSHCNRRFPCPQFVHTFLKMWVDFQIWTKKQKFARAEAVLLQPKLSNTQPSSPRKPFHRANLVVENRQFERNSRTPRTPTSPRGSWPCLRARICTRDGATQRAQTP